MEKSPHLSKNLQNIFFAIWAIVLLLISYGNWNGKVHFGLGLADMIYFVMTLIVVFLIAVILVTSRLSNKVNLTNKNRFFIALFCLVFLVFILLKMTILRGPISPWNGNVFF